jgi:hypothetical protein
MATTPCSEGEGMRALVLLLIYMGVCIAGCGPMIMPMSIRLDEKDQKRYDSFWKEAVHPVDRLTRQELLDAIACTSAFQIGVDRISFRSEKWTPHGLVVMQIQCDRFAPANDRFDISVIDREGKCIRAEHYTREDVESTFSALWMKPKTGATTQETQQYVAECKARFARLHQLFPEMFPTEKFKELPQTK